MAAKIIHMQSPQNWKVAKMSYHKPFRVLIPYMYGRYGKGLTLAIVLALGPALYLAYNRELALEVRLCTCLYCIMAASTRTCKQLLIFGVTEKIINNQSYHCTHYWWVSIQTAAIKFICQLSCFGVFSCYKGVISNIPNRSYLCRIRQIPQYGNV